MAARESDLTDDRLKNPEFPHSVSSADLQTQMAPLFGTEGVFINDYI